MSRAIQHISNTQAPSRHREAADDELLGMADAFRAQLQSTDTLSFEERFALLVDQQWLWEDNRAPARRFGRRT